MGNRRKLPDHEDRIRSKTNLYQKRRSDKSPFHDLLYQPLLYRLLEKKLGNLYTADQILETLRSMQMALLNTASGYIPSYTRTELTDALHKIFDFRTDHEFITKADMRTLIKNTKQIKSKQG